MSQKSGRVLDEDMIDDDSMTVTQNHWDVPESLKRQSDSVRNLIPHTYRSQIFRGASYRVPKVRARESRFAPRVLGLASHYRETLPREASRKESARGSISRKPNSWAASPPMASGYDSTFSLLVLGKTRSRPRPGLPAVFSPSRGLSAPLQGAQVCRGRRDSLSSRRHPFRRITDGSERSAGRERRKERENGRREIRYQV